MPDPGALQRRKLRFETIEDVLAEAERLAAAEREGRLSRAVPNPAFGKLTHEEWVKLNLRHAELHLGFQIPR